MNLGEKLKAANDARALEKSQAEIRKREQEAAAYAADQKTIVAKIQLIIETLTSQIEAGITVKPIKIPTSRPFNTYSWPSNTMVGKFEVLNHPHYTAFQAFFEWAEENGMVGKFNYEWDGGGVSSWFTASVEPKA